MFFNKKVRTEISYCEIHNRIIDKSIVDVLYFISEDNTNFYISKCNSIIKEYFQENITKKQKNKIIDIFINMCFGKLMKHNNIDLFNYFEQKISLID